MVVSSWPWEAFLLMFSSVRIISKLDFYMNENILQSCNIIVVASFSFVNIWFPDIKYHGSTCMFLYKCTTRSIPSNLRLHWLLNWRSLVIYVYPNFVLSIDFPLLIFDYFFVLTNITNNCHPTIAWLKMLWLNWPLGDLNFSLFISDSS